MSVQRMNIGPLETLRVPGETNGLCMVLFHGYGANAFDLGGLHQEINVPAGTEWVFPEGPLHLGGPSRAWWQIDHTALEQAMATGTHRDLTGPPPPGMSLARDNAFAFLRELGVPANRLILGGFSQGAMLAMRLALQWPDPVAGLIMFSGNLVDAETVERLAPERAGLPFFQSHGSMDPVLGFARAREQYDLLTRSGWQGEFHEFSGVHEIPRGTLEGAERLVQRVVSATN